LSGTYAECLPIALGGGDSGFPPPGIQALKNSLTCVPVLVHPDFSSRTSFSAMRAM